MKIPGPDHPISVKPADQRWRARFEGHVIADSNDAVILQEANYPPVVYFPREDVTMEFLARTDRVTYCPYKGDAVYFTVMMDGDIADNAVWSYEAPYPAMNEIRGRLAFYTTKVEVYAVDDAAVNPHHLDTPSVDEAVLHTDSGSGNSQRDHWAPNVTPPPRA